MKITRRQLQKLIREQLGTQTGSYVGRMDNVYSALLPVLSDDVLTGKISLEQLQDDISNMITSLHQAAQSRTI